jgi:exosome complex RNA-binding protein Rrp42 (RNase PH superfamily)
MLKHSAGSALVKLQGGNDNSNSTAASTKILAATTLQFGQPDPEQPDEGEVVVQVSGAGARNMGADFAKSSQSQPHWDVLQSWLQRIMEEDGSIPSQLNIITGKACIRLVVTIIILEDGGNLKDAALLAAMAAWKDTKLPVVGKDLKEVQGKLWWISGNGTTSQRSQEQTLESDTNVRQDKAIRNYRISLSMGVWVDPIKKTTRLLVDPSSEEDPFVEGILTVVISMMTGNLQVDYSGKVALTASDLALASKFAKGRADELTHILSK